MSLAPIHRRRGFRTTLALGLAAAIYLALLATQSDSPPHFFRQFLVHLGIASATFIAVASLFAQFVLPVDRASERQFVIGRLLNYMLGERGPVILVREGEPIESPHEWERRGPGVLMLDHVSAGVMRTDIQFTRTIAPGSVTFSEPGERLAESLDLRRQRRTLPGAPPSTGEPADLAEIGARAVTRDGVPISSTLEVTFMLSRRIPLGRGATTDTPPYDIAEGAIQRAVYSRVIQDTKDIPWTDLPLRMVVDLWREQVKERSLNDLVASENSETSALEQIEAAILTQLSRRDTQPSGQDGRQTPLPSSGSKLLEDRGIRVLQVRIPEIYLPEEMQQERLQAWYESWAGPVQRELAEAESGEREVRRRGRAEAAASMARALTRKLSQGLLWHEPLNQRDSLILLFEDAIEFCSKEPKLSALIGTLRETLDQIKARDRNCHSRRAESETQ